MLSFADIFIILVLNPIITSLILYFLLGNKLLKVFKNFLRAKNASMAKESKAKSTSSGNFITDIIGNIPPEVIGGLLQSFLKPPQKPPSGSVPPTI